MGEIKSPKDRVKEAPGKAVGWLWTQWKNRKNHGVLDKMIKATVATTVAGGLAVGAIGYEQALEAKKELKSISLKEGPAGANGLDGENGIDGKDGADGINGIDGKDGADGKDGKDGLNGTNGIDGKDGLDGTDGAPGEIGPQGPAGETGAQGPIGPQGPPGFFIANGVEDFTQAGGNQATKHNLGTYHLSGGTYLATIWAAFGQSGNTGSFCGVRLYIDDVQVPNAFIPNGVAYRQNFDIVHLTEGPHLISVEVYAPGANGCFVRGTGFIINELKGP